jgi:hypothetical protein
MKLLRTTAAAVSALSLLLEAPGLAHADPPPEAVQKLPPLPGIDPPPQGSHAPVKIPHDSRPDGATLMLISALAIAGGVVLVVYGYEQGVSSVPCPYCAADVGSEVGGAILGGFGLAGLITGIVIYASHEDPTEKQLASPVLPPLLLPRADTAWLRSPVWRDSAREAPAAPAAAVTLFSRSF